MVSAELAAELEAESRYLTDWLLPSKAKVRKALPSTLSYHPRDRRPPAKPHRRLLLSQSPIMISIMVHDLNHQS